MVISAGTATNGVDYDTVVINQTDVPTIRLVEQPTSQEMTLSVGNENNNTARISCTGQFSINTCRTAGFSGYSNGGNLGLNITNAGVVTMPYLPSFQTQGTNYSQTSGAYTKIIPATEMHDNGNNYSSGSFTAPVAVTYEFAFWCLLYPFTSTQTCDMIYKKNNATVGNIIQGGGNATNHQTMSGSIILVLAASDYVDLWLNVTSTTYAYASQWLMSGKLIG